MSEVDFFDPNTWEADAHEYRIYASASLLIYAIVDRDDYHWACRMMWQYKKSRRSSKVYVRRTQTVKANGARYDLTQYLHIEIMLRLGIEPPSPKHIIVDHRNGNSLDCRRNNLRWVTPSMNRRNFLGSSPYDLIEDAHSMSYRGERGHA